MRAGQARLRRCRRAPVARHPRAQGPGRGTLSPDHAAAPQARDAVFAGTRHTPPPKTSTFPRDKAEKSPSQQRDFSIPHSWSQPTKTPTFPHQRTEKSPLQQHVVSYNPVDGGLVLRPVAGWCCGLSRVPAGVGWQSLLVCGLSAPLAAWAVGAEHTKNRRPEGRRLSVRHGGLEPSTR